MQPVLVHYRAPQFAWCQAPMGTVVCGLSGGHLDPSQLSVLGSCQAIWVLRMEPAPCLPYPETLAASEGTQAYHTLCSRVLMIRNRPGIAGWKLFCTTC